MEPEEAAEDYVEPIGCVVCVGGCVCGGTVEVGLLLGTRWFMGHDVIPDHNMACMYSNSIAITIIMQLTHITCSHHEAISIEFFSDSNWLATFQLFKTPNEH